MSPCRLLCIGSHGDYRQQLAQLAGAKRGGHHPIGCITVTLYLVLLASDTYEIESEIPDPFP